MARLLPRLFRSLGRKLLLALALLLAGAASLPAQTPPPDTPTGHFNAGIKKYREGDEAGGNADKAHAAGLDPRYKR